ncbi:hypothetical protein [Erinnyis ello granulovirus]|uniref:Chitin-binding type-2 domain-containing protein n=1 Tax=Erinnyis ello granulovirus TaxID=307444 RepID=A0A097DAP2_9BBAC|nr:hypothetical protein [Erinnyis ello granulovirus]AIS92070.1 hypothetical protein [Erinnyis ello granulovirus]ARX71410.1 hypothetical protein EREL_071 [Erinnyis ello granulovirus]ARX71540.1 hypothetical protein EREL_071 [Erinnyis ello granulovirus]ARX71670.1 hypothetical protein EREL_071 [Erinnyis ello granulovirus]ARX71800.1 hypothetical protein EREL_071 [Erinnyis ello granulovirus]
MIGYIMFVFVFIVFVVFVLQLNVSQKIDNDETDVGDLANSCFRADMRNCQNYYNCLGVLTSCGIQNRFDTTTRQCENYYLTDCGDRYNPPMIFNRTELCTPYWNNQSTQSVFATPICYQALECTTFAMITSCPLGQQFDIPSLTCKPESEVECGSRTTELVFKPKILW